MRLSEPTNSTQISSAGLTGSSPVYVARTGTIQNSMPGDGAGLDGSAAATSAEASRGAPSVTVHPGSVTVSPISSGFSRLPGGAPAPGPSLALTDSVGDGGSALSKASSKTPRTRSINAKPLTTAPITATTTAPALVAFGRPGRHSPTTPRTSATGSNTALTSSTNGAAISPRTATVSATNPTVLRRLASSCANGFG